LSDSFDKLDPNMVLNAVSEMGHEPTGRVFQLNSYENRVFDIELEDHQRVIAKFYRPGRWSKDEILDEHDFLFDLIKEDIPAVAPLIQNNGRSLSEHFGLYLALFPRVAGRLPQELNGLELNQIGRRLAQIHAIGARYSAPHRWRLDAETFGWPSLEVLRDWVYPELWTRYERVAIELLNEFEQVIDDSHFSRIHGDCHRGNLLLQAEGFSFVDFDDFCNGPAVQDLWMLARGDPDETDRNLEALLKGYEDLREFDRTTLEWIEPLRALRLIYYSAWIARRWSDPSFPKIFPDYETYLYWLEEVDELEKIANRAK
jgi:Ser/Thr protein kinase RdoA (MazF antagonist)